MRKKYPIRKQLCLAIGHRDAGNDNTITWEEKSQNSQVVYFQQHMPWGTDGKYQSDTSLLLPPALHQMST